MQQRDLLHCMLHKTLSMTFELKFNNAHDNDDEEEVENFNLSTTMKFHSSECIKRLRVSVQCEDLWTMSGLLSRGDTQSR